MKANKKIVSYLENNTFCVLVPVYYEYEDKPAWRKMLIGSLEECKKQFELYPDYMHATFEENKKHRENKRKEYLLFLSIGKTATAEKIKKQYHL